MQILLAITVLLVFVPASFAGERVITDDGRAVILGDDGQWILASDDRFATTASGERVRLRADGRWEIVSNTPITTPVPTLSVADTGPARWSLRDVIIETAREKRSASKKSTNKQTQTVFHVEAEMKTIEAGPQPWNLTADNVRIVDSSGREYPVTNISPEIVSLSSRASAKVVIRADGSPHWFTTRYFELQISRDSVGNQDEIRLKRAISNVKKREVETLSP